MAEDKVVFYKNKAFRWSWHVVAPNGRVIMTPGQSFYSKFNAKRSAKRVRPDLFT